VQHSVDRLFLCHCRHSLMTFNLLIDEATGMAGKL